MRRSVVVRSVIVFVLIGLAAGGCSGAPVPVTTPDAGEMLDAGVPPVDAAVLDAAADAGADLDASTTLDAGVLDAGPGPILVPRQLAPLTTARVGAVRPTLAFTPVSEPAIQLELCEDSACARVLEDAEVSGTDSQWRPAAALPPGPIFWRIRAGRGAAAVRAWGAWSPTWYFRVPQRGDVDTSYGGWLDVDGDGLTDLVRWSLGSSTGAGIDTGILHLHRGRRGEPPPVEPDQTILVPSAWHRFETLAAADLDGDGATDLVASQWDGVTGPWRPLVHFQVVVLMAEAGRFRDPVELPIDFVPPGDVGGVSALRVIGDVTHDGRPEVGAFFRLADDLDAFWWGIGTVDPSSGLRLGDLAGMRTSPPFGPGVAGLSVGDRDGDGLSELLRPWGRFIGDFEPSGAGVVLEELATTPTDGPLPTDWPDMGDINGDGLSDVVFVRADSATRRGTAYWIPGARAGVPVELPLATPPPESGLEYYGQTLAVIGDVDADGFDDVVIAAANGRPWLLGGRTDGLATVPIAQIGSAPPSVPSIPPFQYGDFDGDGLSDILVNVPIGPPPAVFRQSRLELYLAASGWDAPARTWEQDYASGAPAMVASW